MFADIVVGPVRECELDELVEQLKNMGFDEVVACMICIICPSVCLSVCLSVRLCVSDLQFMMQCLSVSVNSA